ncbi:hypothetical protein AAX26_00808 [Aliarcobacter thereius]|uniref:Lipooligosaccharide transport system, OM translocon component LptE n=2 Tax=Aliarcobacter thereius TaxID=544718 RepID=A0A1C0B808_9BACT|nr:hypothetical protein [Aliarcobacter thereius]OCL87720.1 hypothetical protein AAX26_00808 [Aliarcobacter thereius]OCL93977.1 hypothetical protein AAX25_00299 [Aliarcobacter thereius]OCL95371.1 hypothetical protein AA347_00825 [Aliarcobacter thereius LMG 24486]OCL99736.1 hypothetical protein AAX29_00786 [Aliarcobacter thereius]QBF16640.1 putative lipooligosaccharide transport system, OM component LptE [Aliarcobacter thereius LMG 24486]
MFKKTTLFLLIAIFFSSCGYKPSAYYAKEQLDKNVYVRVEIRANDPRNSVLVKDAITKILIQKIDSKLVDNEFEAEVIMDLSIKSVSFNVLQYDKDGHNKLYKAKVNLGVKYFTKSTGKTIRFDISGENDFAIGQGVTLNDTHRFEAVSKASDMAVSELLSRVAVASFE